MSTLLQFLPFHIVFCANGYLSLRTYSVPPVHMDKKINFAWFWEPELTKYAFLSQFKKSHSAQNFPIIRFGWHCSCGMEEMKTHRMERWKQTKSSKLKTCLEIYLPPRYISWYDIRFESKSFREIHWKWKYFSKLSKRTSRYAILSSSLPLALWLQIKTFRMKTHVERL